MIYTSYYEFVRDINPKHLISISGRPPEYWTGEHMQKLSPFSFFMYWKHTYVPTHTAAQSIAEYRRLFSERVLSRLDPVTISQQIGDNRILCCFEKNGPQDVIETFCHRHIIADWLREYGVSVQELTTQTKENFIKQRSIATI